MSAVTPDLVLTDVVMFRKRGIELCREIKADPELRATPVIMLTARVGPEATLEAFDAGADDFIAKPFHPQHLLARIETQLRLRAARHCVASVQEQAAALVAEVRGRFEALAGAVTRLEGRAPATDLRELRDSVASAARHIEDLVARLGA